MKLLADGILLGIAPALTDQVGPDELINHARPLEQFSIGLVSNQTAFCEETVIITRLSLSLLDLNCFCIFEIG